MTLPISALGVPRTIAPRGADNDYDVRSVSLEAEPQADTRDASTAYSHSHTHTHSRVGDNRRSHSKVGNRDDYIRSAANPDDSRNGLGTDNRPPQPVQHIWGLAKGRMPGCAAAGRGVVTIRIARVERAKKLRLRARMEVTFHKGHYETRMPDYQFRCGVCRAPNFAVATPAASTSY